MPVHEDGYLREFTDEEIADMRIRTFRVRDGDHPTEVLKPDERSMVRTFLVDWQLRYAAVELILGNEKMYNHFLDPPANTMAERRLSRLLPHRLYGRHPEAARRQIMATEVVSMKGHGAGIDDRYAEEDADEGDLTRMPEYTDAVIEVRYEHHPFEVGSANAPKVVAEMDKYVQLDGSVSGENEIFGPIPGNVLRAARDGGGGFSGTPMPYGFSISRAVEKLTLVHHKLPYECVTDLGALQKRLNLGDPDDAQGMRPYRGTVNSHAMEFGSFGRSFPAGTMLLDRTEFRTLRSPHAEEGTIGLRASVYYYYVFCPTGWLDLYMYDPNGANTGYYQAGDGTFYAVADMPDDTGLYNVRDHRKLFNFDY
jgi:hypothetical protein